jgi:ribonuclease D
LEELMLVANTVKLEQVIRACAAAEAYALDTEFHAEGRYFPRLALVQLAVPGLVAVVDATAVDLRCLAPLLAGPGLAVTHAGERDLAILDRECGARPARVLDTQIAAGFLGYGTPSLALLVSELLGRRIDKGQQMSNWFKRPLAAEQIAYAEADVAHLLELRAVLEARLADLGRLQWAIEESDRVSLPRPVDDDTAWWRLRGASQLTVQAKARPQELAAWRERTARSADRPVSSILPDEVIVGLADQPPRSAADIPRSRMFDPRKLAPATVRDVLAAAARGTDLSTDDIRFPPDRLPSRLQGLAGLLTAWVQQTARDLSIDAALLATRRDLEAYLLNEPECRLREGWRGEAIGAAVDQIATGRAAVAYDGQALVLVDR